MDSELFNEKGTNLTDKQKYLVQPGYIFASCQPYLLSSVLGSCVSVCLWDSKLKLGGMNHYVYAKPGFFKKERTARYGNISIPHLIKLMKKMGCENSDLRAHIIGGAHNREAGSYAVGKNNVETAKRLLKKNGIDITTIDSGDKMGRKVVFDTETGELIVYKVNNLRESDWYVD